MSNVYADCITDVFFIMDERNAAELLQIKKKSHASGNTVLFLAIQKLLLEEISNFSNGVAIPKIQ